ncbi:hypothetical protein SERLA73DRAFT_178202, partial [Serpula lacrymans var. lacrymans S7.3]
MNTALAGFGHPKPPVTTSLPSRCSFFPRRPQCSTKAIIQVVPTKPKETSASVRVRCLHVTPRSDLYAKRRDNELWPCDVRMSRGITIHVRYMYKVLAAYINADSKVLWHSTSCHGPSPNWPNGRHLHLSSLGPFNNARKPFLRSSLGSRPDHCIFHDYTQMFTRSGGRP